MNFKTWLEGIETPPHMPNIFWRGALKRAEEIESNFMPLKDIERMERELEDDEYVDMRLSRDFPHKIRLILKGDGYNDKLSEKIRSLMNSADFARTHPEQYWGEYGVVARLDILGDSKGAATNYTREYTEFFRKKKRHHNYGEVERADVGSESREKILKLKSVYDAVFDYIRLIKKVGRAAKAAIAHRQHKVKAFHSGGEESKVMPETRKVEVLYHATPYVREILREGFKTKESMGNRESLGGATDGGISFTADLRIAREIARCLVEAIRIAKGKTTVNDILRLINAEREKGKVPWALSDYISTAKSRQWRWNPSSTRALAKETGKPLPGKPYEINDRKQAFNLYKRYLAWSDRRYDPLFFGVDISNFENMDESNVGVVAAKVDMTKAIGYHAAMEEYRAPVEAIIQVAAPGRFSSQPQTI